MSPLWGFRVFAYPVCYKHAAPLGLNAPMECFSCSTFNTTLRSAGMRGLASSRFYRHIARLEEKQANHSLPLRPNHGGLVSKPDGLGDPTPTHLTSVCPFSRFTYHANTCRPSGALGYLRIPCAINMPPRWG